MRSSAATCPLTERSFWTTRRRGPVSFSPWDFMNSLIAFSCSLMLSLRLSLSLKIYYAAVKGSSMEIGIKKGPARARAGSFFAAGCWRLLHRGSLLRKAIAAVHRTVACLLYTSDAADERSSVDLGGR